MNLELLDAINQCLDRPCTTRSRQLELIPVAGGDSCQSYHIITPESRASYFIKTQPACFLEHFEVEQAGLHAIAQTQTIRTPRVIGLGKTSTQCFLLMEYLPLTPSGSQHILGEQLAKLHRHKHTQFGFSCDNAIGKSVQKNRFNKNWATFWREQRLQVQLELAYQNQFQQSLEPFEKELLDASDLLLSEHETQASLVHGDLWGGNKGFLNNDCPVIFDPAIYYGDREVDIAMTRLFGGFNDHFYRAYNEVWPLPKDANKRVDLYNLYHQLNHLNLFGQSYLSDCITSIKSIIQTTK